MKITLGNTDSSTSFDEIFDKLEVRGKYGWLEATQNKEVWDPDKRSMKLLYDSGVLKMISLNLGSELCGHLIYSKQRRVFNKTKATLNVLSLYVYPEFRQNYIMPQVLRFLKDQARKQACKSILLSLPAYLRTSDKLSRVLGHPGDYLYELEL